MSLKDTMPLLARHEGVWEGYYRYYDYDGNKSDEHRSRLLCRLPTPESYHQTNLYRWADGRTETKDFPSRVEGNRLIFYTEIQGWAAEVPLDENSRTMMLHWRRTNEPGLYLYEMIQLSDDGNHRARVWQWFREGKLFQRTLVDERRKSNDWRQFDGQDPSYEDLCAF